MSKILSLLLLLGLPRVPCLAQVTVQTGRAQIEVAGKTIFGTGNATSAFSHAIGFNLYNDGGNLRYLANGFAGTMSYNSGATNSFDFTVYPSGTAEAIAQSGAVTGLRLGTPTGTKIMTSQTLSECVLDVGRGTNFNGTAQFTGTDVSSHFNYGVEENTYIRGGKWESAVIINDVASGPGANSIIIGNGTGLVGVNYNNPTYTFEIRQVGGTGLKFNNVAGGNWEWRVNGSNANFYALYGDAIKTYFSPTDGTLHPVSDERLKTDIEQLSPVLEKLLMLKPVHYVMKFENPNRIRSMGFIAQDVQKLFPALVTVPRSGPGYQTLSYSGLAVLAVKAIQEEQSLIEEMEQKANKAEALLDKITRSLNKKRL